MREDISKLSKATKRPRGRPRTQTVPPNTVDSSDHKTPKSKQKNAAYDNTLYRCRHCGLKHMGHKASLDYVVFEHSSHGPKCPRFDARYRFDFKRSKLVLNAAVGPWKPPLGREMSVGELVGQLRARGVPFQHCPKAQLEKRLRTYDALGAGKLSVFPHMSADQFACQCCRQQHVTRAGLLQHLRVQQTIRSPAQLTADRMQATVWCPCCRSGFASERALSLHLARRTVTHTAPPKATPLTFHHSVGRIAAKALRALPAAAQAIRNHLKWQIDANLNEVRGAVCAHCGHQETKLWRMVKHLLEHHQVFPVNKCTCLNCGMDVGTLWRMLAHAETCGQQSAKHDWKLAEERSMVGP